MPRLKACSTCGKIHDASITCAIRNPKIDKEYALRQTNRWHAKSIEIRERSQWLCSVCRDKGIITHEGLEVHHIVKLRDNPDLLLDDNNLICLCVDHHKQADAGILEPDYLRKLAKKRDSQR